MIDECREYFNNMVRKDRHDITRFRCLIYFGYLYALKPKITEIINDIKIKNVMQFDYKKHGFIELMEYAGKDNASNVCFLFVCNVLKCM